MKKLIALVIIGLFIGGMTAFADDAKVMPKRVGRVYVAPAFGFANGYYDEDGNYHKYPDGGGALKAFNLSFAVEYGINDWITAAVQWGPGWNVWSDVDKTLTNPNADANVNGVYDLFVGAKIQLVGEKAPVKNEMFRVALAPGVKIPLPGPDYEDQLANMANGDDVTVANVDKHVFGFGARGYFDYVINKMFFINLYGEFIYYPVKGDLADSSLTDYGASLNPTLAGTKVSYGYDLTVELEPHFDTTLTEGLNFSAGLPVRFKTNPGNSYDNDLWADDDPWYKLVLVPNVSFFLTKTLLPLEFKLSYEFPVWGMGPEVQAIQNVNLQIKVYFKI